MTPKTPSVAVRAEAAIRYFEEQGREVVGVRLKGSEFHIDFARSEQTSVPEADLVDMSG